MSIKSMTIPNRVENVARVSSSLLSSNYFSNNVTKQILVKNHFKTVARDIFSHSILDIDLLFFILEFKHLQTR